MPDREPRPYIYDNAHVYSDTLRAIVDDSNDSRRHASYEILSATGVAGDSSASTALKVTASATPGAVDIGAGAAIDSNGEIIHVPDDPAAEQNGTTGHPALPVRQAISVPTSGAYQDAVTYYVKIAYLETGFAYETDFTTGVSYATRYARSYTITIDTDVVADPEVLLATILGGDGGATLVISDTRTFLSGRITDIRDDNVASDAAIGQEKIDNTDVQDDRYTGTPTSLVHDLNQIRTVIRSHKDASAWTGAVHDSYQHYAHDVYVVDASGSLGGNHDVEACLLYLGETGGLTYNATIDLFNMARSRVETDDYGVLTDDTWPKIYAHTNAFTIRWESGEEGRYAGVQITVPADYMTGSSITMNVIGRCIDLDGTVVLTAYAYLSRTGVDSAWSPVTLVNGSTVTFTTLYVTEKTITIPGSNISAGDVLFVRIACTSISTSTGLDVGGWSLDYTSQETR